MANHDQIVTTRITRTTEVRTTIRVDSIRTTIKAMVSIVIMVREVVAAAVVITLTEAGQETTKAKLGQDMTTVITVIVAAPTTTMTVITRREVEMIPKPGRTSSLNLARWRTTKNLGNNEKKIQFCKYKIFS
jgi:hypothetical protein